MEATIEFRDDCYYAGLWFVRHDKNLDVADRIDWLACAWRKNDEQNTWQIVHRLRYHKTDKAFASGDRFKIFRGTKKCSEEQIVKELSSIAAIFGANNNVEPSFVPIRGNGRKGIEELSKQPWANMKKIPINIPPREKFH